MSSSFKHIYLPQLPGSPSVRYSRGAQRRAAQLQQFLRLVEVGLAGKFGAWHSPELVVLSKQDWRQVYSAAYGLPRLRGRSGAWQVYAAAEYPQKFIQRFEPVLVLGAAEDGSPGELREFLDLLIAQTHLMGALRGLDTLSTKTSSTKTSSTKKVKGWLEPVVSAYALYGSLQASGLDALAERFKAWAVLESRGGEAVSVAKLRSRRLSFPQTRWAHGVSASYGIQRFEQEEWNLAERLGSETDKKGGLESLFAAFLEGLLSIKVARELELFDETSLE